MASLSEGPRQGDIVRWEVDRNFSREEVTVYLASGTIMKRGTVLGILTADGKYTKSASGVSTGLQNAVAILLDDIVTDATGVKATVLQRFGIIVQSDLVWDATYDTDNKKAVAIANLKSSSNILAVPALRYV